MELRNRLISPAAKASLSAPRPRFSARALSRAAGELARALLVGIVGRDVRASEAVVDVRTMKNHPKDTVREHAGDNSQDERNLHVLDEVAVVRILFEVTHAIFAREYRVVTSDGTRPEASLPMLGKECRPGGLSVDT